MLTKFSRVGLALFAFGCTTEATEAEIKGCREGCRTELVCALNQAEDQACGAGCAEKIEAASDSCRKALAQFGNCTQGLNCSELELGTCDVQNRAVVENCSGFTIDAVINDRPDGGYSVPDGGIPSKPDARPDEGVRDAGFADPNTLLEGLEEINGLKTYIKLAGTKTSTMPPAVVINGGAVLYLPIIGSVIAGPGLSHEYLVPFMEPIQEGRLLIYYDMRATGRSSYGTIGGTSTVTLSQHVNDLGDVIDFVKDFSGQTKVDLLGFGYGALVGALFASQNPSRISRMVATTPFPTNNPQYRQYINETRGRMNSDDFMRAQSIAGFRPQCLQNESQCFLQLWNITGPKTMCDADKFVELSFLYGSGRALFYVVQQLTDSGYDVTAALRDITAPTTIISGRCDTIPAEAAMTYATEISGAVHHILPDSGAFPFVETSTTYSRLLKSALTYP